MEQRWWMVLLWDNRCRQQDYSRWRHFLEDRDKMKLNLSLFHIQNTQCHRQASVSLNADEQLRPLQPFFLPHTFQIHLESHWQTVQLLNEKSIIFGKIKTLDQVYFYTSRSCSKTRSSLWKHVSIVGVVLWLSFLTCLAPPPLPCRFPPQE
jgi:hypothetical protein